MFGEITSRACGTCKQPSRNGVPDYQRRTGNVPSGASSERQPKTLEPKAPGWRVEVARRRFALSFLKSTYRSLCVQICDGCFDRLAIFVVPLDQQFFRQRYLGQNLNNL